MSPNDETFDVQIGLSHRKLFSIGWTFHDKISKGKPLLRCYFLLEWENGTKKQYMDM